MKNVNCRCFNIEPNITQLPTPTGYDNFFDLCWLCISLRKLIHFISQSYESLSSRGKSSKCWFLGFKLQVICNADVTLVRLFFRLGNEHNCHSFIDITESLEGLTKEQFEMYPECLDISSKAFLRFYSIMRMMFSNCSYCPLVRVNWIRLFPTFFVLSKNA